MAEDDIVLVSRGRTSFSPSDSFSILSGSSQILVQSPIFYMKEQYF